VSLAKNRAPAFWLRIVGMRRRWFFLSPIVIVAALYWAVPWMVAVPGSLTAPLPESPRYTDRHGVLLRADLVKKSYRHRYTPLGEIPGELIAFTLAAEDRRFYRHGGIDFLALLRAAWDNITHGRIVSGASTLTQQLAKFSLPPAKRSYLRKLQEMLIARRLEMTWSKDRILTEYLNRVEYGSMTRGCAAAAYRFFQKPIQQLAPGECALLAALPQAPSRLSPLRHPERAEFRRQWILARTSTTSAKPLLNTILPGPIAPHALNMLSRANDRGEVRTTIDSAIQRSLSNILAAQIGRLRDFNVANSAGIVIDNATGDILALVGTGDFFSPRGGQINGAIRQRSAGSTLKPFTVAAAFERGWGPYSIIPDVLTRYPGPGGFFIPENYDRRYHGPVPIRSALANSMNAAAVALLNQIGGSPTLVETLRRAGFQNLRAPQFYGLGLTIGNGEVRLIDITNAYAALARGGEWKPPRLRIDDSPAASRSIFSAETAFLIADILSDNAARSAAFGVESPLRLPFRCAAKTGTSSDFRDNWCIGFTTRYTVGIWMGNHDRTPMRGVSGITGSAFAFQEIMQTLHEKQPPTDFIAPPTLMLASIDTRTGHLASPGPWTRMEWVQKSQPPATASAADYAPGDNAIIDDATYAEWFRSPDHRHTSGVSLASSLRLQLVSPRLLSPQPGTTYVIDPELPGSSRTLPLVSNISNPEWSSPTLAIRNMHGTTMVTLVPGEHQITLRDTTTGLQNQADIVVKQR